MKKFICFILSLLMIATSLCFASCDSADVGDIGGVGGGDIIGGLSTDEEQKTDENKNPFYVPPAKFKELAKDDTVYNMGIYTGYSIVIEVPMQGEKGAYLGSNLDEVMLKYPGEALPVHEDPTCTHDTARCPTSAESLEEKAIIVEQESGLPLIFYFGRYRETLQNEEGETTARPVRIIEARCYDVETGEYTTIGRIPFTGVDKTFLYKGRIYVCAGASVGGGFGNIGTLDIVTGEYKTLDRGGYYNEYSILGFMNDRLWYIRVTGDENLSDADRVETKENIGTIESCAPDLEDARVEYELGNIGNDDIYPRYGDELSKDTYMLGSVIFFPRNFHVAADPMVESPGENVKWGTSFFTEFDLYAIDMKNISAGEKLVIRDVYKLAGRDGKLYYTHVDYKEIGRIKEPGGIFTDQNGVETIDSFMELMFVSTDGGTLYEYDIAAEKTREICRDSGYNVFDVYEVTDDGKMFFKGYQYADIITEDEGYYYSFDAERKDYCMLDLSTGEITEMYAPLRLEEPPEG